MLATKSGSSRMSQAPNCFSDAAVSYSYMKAFDMPYLPVYNERLCIIRTPISDFTLEKKKKRKQTSSSLQKCHSMHQPQNDQFFQWTILVVNHGYCLLSTASSSLITQGTLWVRELRSILEELELNQSFLLRIRTTFTS